MTEERHCAATAALMSIATEIMKSDELPNPLLDAEFLRAFEYALGKHRTQK